MHRLRTFVPSANYLFAFEAAARHLSFSAAARELNVSQPAVSKTIKLLEAATGLKLFSRSTGRLALTAEGKRLYLETQGAFDHLHLVISSLLQKDLKDTVHVSFSATFVQLWLIPRLDAFKDVNPNIALRIEESARDDEDLEREDIDLSARLGDGHWGDVRSWHFADEEVLPVCSPTYLRKHGPIGSVDGLATQTLLHFEERHRLRLRWADWFKHCGLVRPKLTKGLVFTDNLGSVQAALRGQGVALGWRHLIGDQLKSRRLVPALDVSYRSGDAVFLVMPIHRKTKLAAEQFRDWLLKYRRNEPL